MEKEFKVGDKVRILDSLSIHHSIEDIGVITEVGYGCCRVVTDNNINYANWQADDDLQLVTSED